MLGLSSGEDRVEYGALELAFETKSLRTLCEREKSAERELGIKVAKMLKHRLADLSAASSAKDIVAGKPTVMQSNPHQQMSIQLGEGFRLVLAANHSKIPILEEGIVDWSNVSRIKVVKIEANHD